LRVNAHLYLAVGMALLIGMLVASYMQASAGLDAMKQFDRATQRADQLDRLNQLLADAQSANRGYALTRDPLYLDTFRATLPAIQDTLGVIKAEYKDDGDDASKLVEYAHGAAARMDITTRLMESGKPPRKSWFDESTVAMAAYRRQHHAMKAALLAENRQNVQQSVNGFENARIVTVLLAIASLLLLLLSVSQKQKGQELRDEIQRMLEAKNERLEREVNYRTQELTSLATYLTEVREKEKLHLAREMHDELGALLTAAKLDADWIERTLPPESQALVAQRLARLRQSLISGITLKRRITNDLRPALLYDLGLVEALKALIAEFQAGEEIEVKADLPESEPELSEALSLSLFRIVQEALTNIRKYAQAHRVEISLRPTPTAIELSIADDGVGFDPASPKLARHGLAGIKHRVFTHGGELDIRTAPGAGVILRAVLPV
jgi:protein-histidine pros-kinase